MWGSRSSYSIELSFDIFMSFSSIYIQLGSLDTIVRGTFSLWRVLKNPLRTQNSSSWSVVHIAIFCETRNKGGGGRNILPKRMMSITLLQINYFVSTLLVTRSAQKLFRSYVHLLLKLSDSCHCFWQKFFTLSSTFIPSYITHKTQFWKKGKGRVLFYANKKAILRVLLLQIIWLGTSSYSI